MGLVLLGRGVLSICGCGTCTIYALTTASKSPANTRAGTALTARPIMHIVRRKKGITEARI